MKLNGKVALVTGGGTGIGAAIAERFVSEGARVCITGRRQEMLDKVAQSFPAGMVTICSGDVSQIEDVERMVGTTLDFGGKLDVLVNNAGISFKGSITDLDPAVWRNVMEVNVTGPFLLMKTAMRHLIKSGAGSIINISSLGGLRCNYVSPAYDTSKAALIMLTQQVALDYGQYNVRCNVVCPGAIKTPMSERSVGGVAQQLGMDEEALVAFVSSDVPLRRRANPSEISGICVYLASEDASFMTGAVLLVDGGAAIVDAGQVAMRRAARDAGLV